MFRKPASPAKVPTDTVVPLHFFDDTPLWRAFILYSMFVFDAVLDPVKLRNSLEALAKRDGWRKLGARMRRTQTGSLEYHIPSEFTDERPALSYSHISHNTCAAEHPIASRLPRPSSRPATVCDPDTFRELFLPQGGPVKLDDYLARDVPQIGLHVVSFTDRTLVTIYWPHTLMDAMGQRALLDAWMLKLAGRDDDIPMPHGADASPDPLADLGKNPTESHKLSLQRMSTFGLAKYGLGNVFDFLRSQENRMVCVPSSFLTGLRDMALAQLASDGHESPFLTEGDVLCAWWTRIVITHLPRDSQRSVVLNNAYSMRDTLAGDLLPGKGSTYVSNAISFIPVLLTAQDIFEKPLGHIALQIRRAITSLGTRAQVEAFTGMWREAVGKLPPFFGDGTMHMLTYSNWSKAKLYEVDFSGAITTPCQTTGSTGKPTYVQNNQFGLVLPNGFPIIGKDNGGNYWLSGYLNQGQWAKIEEELAKA
ncbi:hypothetical protein F4809DRAFT_625518 [Biscogniauxia mediterranea]|nr:hypothetical protein F4809DRAFT_625518 [Biscogniauxia mediterranea]